MANILIGVCTYPDPPYIHPRTRDAMTALISTTRHNYTLVHLGDDDPELGHYPNLVRKHNALRHMVLESDHDALLTIEADMIVPPDALDKLWAVDADVVYGLYVARISGMWLCMTEASAQRGKSIAADPKRARQVLQDGAVVESAGVGFGCTLVRRNVLEAVEFRLLPKSTAADDWAFALDVAAAGFRQAHHCGVVCGHILDDETVLWPADGEKLTRIEGQAMDEQQEAQPPEPFTVRVLRTLVTATGDIRPGATVTMGANEARVLMRRGFVEIVDGKTVDEPATLRRARGKRRGV